MFIVEVDQFLSLAGDIEGGLCHSNELGFWNFLRSWFSVNCEVILVFNSVFIFFYLVKIYKLIF